MERDDDFERRQEEEAAAEAADIGGKPGLAAGYEKDPTTPGLSDDPATAPVQDAGGGEAEGFELAEAQLIDRAENARGPSPLADQERGSEDDRAQSVYGEADEEHTSEDDPEESER
jgi:hypothetical protein